MRYSFGFATAPVKTGEDRESNLGHPSPLVIDEINRLYQCGHDIEIVLPQENASRSDWQSMAEAQLDCLGLKYHRLIRAGQVKAFPVISVSGREIDFLQWQTLLARRVSGVFAGSFDLLHPGYIAALQEAKEVCNYLVIALHTDPRIERPTKSSPLVGVEDRERALLECRSVDEVVRYDTEAQLERLLTIIKPQIRLLGDDYRGRDVTAESLNIPKHYFSRSHGWSMTKVRALLKGHEGHTKG